MKIGNNIVTEHIKRFIDLRIPVTTCNLRCQYCYITQHRLFNAQVPELPYSGYELRKALSKERLGGTCFLNLCGDGETLLPSKIVEYIQALLEEGHYVGIVTNATTTQRFRDISNFPKELFSRLFFKFSYHYIELKKRNLLDAFFDNVLLMRNMGCSFTLEITPHDELIPYIDELCSLAIEKTGALPHCTVARDETVSGDLPILTKLSLDEYQKTWSKLHSSLFEYKYSIFGEKRKEFCYAGSWSCIIYLRDGIMKQCYKSIYNQNIFKDLHKPIRFIPIGNNCCEYHCYNGHAFLTWGAIPNLKAPNYGDVRNHICNDGSEWIYPQMKAFMETKLHSSNKELLRIQKCFVNSEMKMRKTKRLLTRYFLNGFKILNKFKKK